MSFVGKQVVVDLRLVLAVLLQVLFVHTGGLGHFGNGLHGGFLCDFDVCFECHNITLLVLLLVPCRYMPGHTGLRAKPLV